MYPEVTFEPSTSAKQRNFQYKHVVIVGNGPSAISLSYMLSGNWPYYASDALHPNEFLHMRLDSNRSKSVIMQDLCMLSEGLEGRSDNPVSLLFDTLNHPDADLGVDLPSCLNWLYHPDRRIDHVVIGRSLPGGSWQNMEQSALTLSLEPWMDMPGYRFKDWEKDRHRDRSKGSSLKRASVGKVARYYREFVVAQNMESSFRNHCVVTSVRPLDRGEMAPCDWPSEANDQPHLWEVVGHCKYGNHFCYVTPNVVLATGTYDEPNRLNVLGEDLPYVWHYSNQLEKHIMEHNLGPQSDPVLIVGAGLTAADAIITARFFGVPVAHVFRRDVADPALIFNRLPENMYPDYHKVHQMMRQQQSLYKGYQAYPRFRVVELLEDHKVRIEGEDSSLVLKVSVVLVLIGSKANFSFLQPDLMESLKGNDVSKRDLIRVDAYSYESLQNKGLFAMGPLVGDNFVRFLQGGSLAIASHLAKTALKTASAEMPQLNINRDIYDDNDLEPISDLDRNYDSDDVSSNGPMCFKWSRRVLSCPEGIETDQDGSIESLELEQTIEMLQRRCRFRSKRRQQKQQQQRRRRASHSSGCDNSQRPIT
ncbi:Oxidative stress-induced growth inhibitor 2 [Chamberlinius hualienensis]